MNHEKAHGSPESNDDANKRHLFLEILKDSGPTQLDEIKSQFENADAYERLRLLSFLYDAALEYAEPTGLAEEYYWAFGKNSVFEGFTDEHSSAAYDDVADIYENLKNGDYASPLFIIVADFFKNLATKMQNGPHYVVNNVSALDKDIKIDQDDPPQAQIYAEYPTLSQGDNLRLVRIAPGIAASATEAKVAAGVSMGDDYTQLLELADRQGRKSVLSEIDKNNPFDLSEDDISLLNMAHINGIKKSINKWLGIDITDISLNAQIQLLRYMTEAQDHRLENLRNVMHGIDNNLRLKLAENFLAADFGEDFGDALLVIAESNHLADAEKAKIFDTLSSCRQSIHGITSLYSDIHDGQFTKQYARAANERLTDAVTVFREIAQTGTAEADLDWAGRSKFDYNSAIEALEYEEKSLEIINGVLQDISSRAEGSFAELILEPDRLSAKENRSLYNLYSENFGHVLLYTRPEGSHVFNPALEYGKNGSRYDYDSNNGGVEASISFITNPNDPFTFPNPFRMRKDAPNDKLKSDKVSAIRLDREGRTAEMAPNDPERDVNRPQGICSVDLAAIGDPSSTPSGKIARLFSTGGKIRANINHTESSLNHNTKWFNQEQYGSAAGFYKLVIYLDSIVNGWATERPASKDNPHSFAYLKKQKRVQKIGRQARKLSA